MKTNFGPGVIVTSKWLNGARELHFDGKDLDWHYAPINRRDIQRGGPDGIDNVYVTTNTRSGVWKRSHHRNEKFYGTGQLR